MYHVWLVVCILWVMTFIGLTYFLSFRYSGWRGGASVGVGVIVSMGGVFVCNFLASPVLKDRLWKKILIKHITWHVKGEKQPPSKSCIDPCNSVTLTRQQLNQSPGKMTFSIDHEYWRIVWWKMEIDDEVVLGDEVPWEDFRWCAVFQDELGGEAGGATHTKGDASWQIVWVRTGAKNPVGDP